MGRRAARGVHRRHARSRLSLSPAAGGLAAAEWRSRLGSLPSMANSVDGRLDGKVAVVTGASTGIGRATFEMFARAGATVVGASRTQSKLDEALAAVEAQGGTGDRRVRRPLDRRGGGEGRRRGR